VISYYHRQLQTACDEIVITTDCLLPRPKNVSDGLYKPLVIGLNVVVLQFSLNEGSEMEVLVRNLVEAMAKRVPKTSWHLGSTRNQPKKIQLKDTREFHQKMPKSRDFGAWNKIDRCWASSHVLNKFQGSQTLKKHAQQSPKP